MFSYYSLMRNILIILCSLIFLTGCMGDATNGGGSSEIILHKEQLFEVAVPASWVEITRAQVSELQRNFVFAYARPDYVDGFATNMTVVTEDLVHIKDAEAYASANMIAASRDVLDYQPLHKQTVTITDGTGEQRTTLHVFEGRYRRTDPLTKFIQMYLIKNNKGYVMTVNLPYAETNYQRYIDSLFLSFRFY